jgi:hypothetical protein
MSDYEPLSKERMESVRHIAVALSSNALYPVSREWAADVMHLIQEVQYLREELTEMYVDILVNVGSLIHDPDHEANGWYCSNAMRDPIYAGDKLVELGLWEKHPTAGHGRVQYYRPKKGDTHGMAH